MKNLIVLTLILIPLFGLAQTKEVVYDYKNDRIEGLESVKVGEFVIFKVKNINTFRYKVEIEGKSIDYVTAIPSELQQLFRLPENIYQTSAANSEKGLAEIAMQLPLMDGVKENAEEKVNDAKEAAVVDQQSVQKKEKLVQVLDKLLEDCEAFLNNAKNVARIKFARMDLIQASKQKWDSHKSMLGELPPVLPKEVMQQMYLDFIETYSIAEAQYKRVELAAFEAGSTKEELQLINAALNGIEEGYELISDENYLKLIEDVNTLYTAMQNKEYFEVTSAPIQMDGDFVQFDVTVTPAGLNDLMPYESAKTTRIEVPTKGGWTADFSVGPMVLFGKKAKDRLYFLQEDLSDSTVTLKEENNKNKIRPAMASMIHVHPRLGAQWSAGFMLGVGIDFQAIDDPDVSLYMGGSLVLGKREKVMLSAGVAFTRVERLKSNEFPLDQKYGVGEIDLSEVTSKVFKPTGFFSISYNLTNKVEIK